MAKQKKEETIVDVEKVYTRTERFYNNNKQYLNIGALAVVGIIAGYFAFINFYQKPREAEAQELMWKAEYYFEVDSLNLAIAGDGNYLGFDYIANEYSGTKAARLANYYMGICYYRLGDYTSAISLLKKADLEDDMVASIALGTIGDAYVELEQYATALDYFDRAANNSNNVFTAPIYLKKKAILLENMGEYQKALDTYKKIKKDFGNSAEGQEMDKYIARAQVLIK